MSAMLVVCSKCGAGWIDNFTEKTAKCPKCGNGSTEVRSVKK